jgi:hypothetical protein
MHPVEASDTSSRENIGDQQFASSYDMLTFDELEQRAYGRLQDVAEMIDERLRID